MGGGVRHESLRSKARNTKNNTAEFSMALTLIIIVPGTSDLKISIFVINSKAANGNIKIMLHGIVSVIEGTARNAVLSPIILTIDDITNIIYNDGAIKRNGANFCI